MMNFLKGQNEETGPEAELESVYEDQLREAAARMETQFGQTVAAAQQEFGKFLARLEEESRTAQTKKMEEFNRVVDDALLSFTTQLVTKVTLAEEAAKGEIEAGKQKALAGLESRMTGVLEKTTKIVLGKALSLADQTDLVIEALEQAKKEEFLS